MNSILVTYYSRSGYTRKVANALARALDADLDEITESRPRLGIAGYLRSGFEAVRAARPPLLESRHQPKHYRKVVIGTPVWAGHVASPVRSYLLRYATDLQHAGFFCSYGGSGADKVLTEMAGLVGHAAEATLALTDREIDAGAQAAIDRFAKTLRLQHP
ncbi:MAG: hypothetical protein M0P72_14365 [Metallibacterium scheffleri]|uniref:flavodoxin family protein n=1 Tax=Metallibacterium scheffleri TaxID=993689 RepID=UPI0026EF9E4F|nr:flavodoxin [Metallibacterium scheffleri]MCK9368314.1 hypothetical protein [Metallibacterium scheffleri]